MKIKTIPFICLAVLFVFISSASAVKRTHVVYQQGQTPCTTGDDSFEYVETNIEDADPTNDYPLYCNELIPGINTNCKEENIAYYETSDPSKKYCRNAIQEAYYKTCSSPGDTIIVCPGTYKENVFMQTKGNHNLSIISWSRNPADTIIEAMNPNKNVFLIHGLNSSFISGLTIRGATGGDYPVNGNGDPENGCVRMYNANGNPVYFDEDPKQPCAGIRYFCLENGIVANNHITGNNHGVIVKDTLPVWSFFNFIENNDIYDNQIGVHLRYGSNSYVTDNRIIDNSTGIKLIDTWQQKIVGNTVEDNNIGIQIRASFRYPECVSVSDNVFYSNTLSGNTTPVDEDNCPDPILLPQEYEFINFACPYDCFCPWDPVDENYMCQYYLEALPACGSRDLVRTMAWSLDSAVTYSDTLQDALYIGSCNPTWQTKCHVDSDCPESETCNIESTKYQIQAMAFNGNLNINNPNFMFVDFYSGYDCNYIANNGTTSTDTTTLEGELKVSNGVLRLMSGTFKVTKSN